MTPNEHNECNTLVCWIGDTDLLAFGKEGKDKGIPNYYQTARKVLEADKPSEFRFDEEVNNLNTDTRNSSIIIALKESRNKSSGIPKFTHVLLFTNRPSQNAKLLNDFKDHFASFICSKFKDLAGRKVTVEFVPSKDNPQKGVDGWNYKAVIDATRTALERRRSARGEENYWFNITPGTIAQSTSLILVGKEKGANFIQVEKSRSRVDRCEIPLDLSAAFGKSMSQFEKGSDAPPNIIGKAPSLRKALETARKIAKFPVSVLLTGPSGTGKEAFAREIHRRSGRPENKFVAINCAMLSKETGVTDLTGYFKGAYTGADETTPGKFHEAKDGTLFLDEIGDCPSDVQAELLRFLQPLNVEKPSERVWTLKGNPPARPNKDEKEYVGKQKGDIRVIAATNRNLQDTTLFRQDLYFRLEPIRIDLPSLETRKAETDRPNGIDDLKELADFFLGNFNRAFKLDPERSFSQDAYEALHSHRWTGNVRELQNTVMRLALLCDRPPTITKSDVEKHLNQEASREEPPKALPAPSQQDVPLDSRLRDVAAALARHDIESRDIKSGKRLFDARIDEFKHAYCTAALEATSGNKKEAYSILRTNSKTFKKALAPLSP